MNHVFFILTVVFFFLESISFVMLKDLNLKYNQMRYRSKMYPKRFFYPGHIWNLITLVTCVNSSFKFYEIIIIWLLIVEVYNFVLYFSIKAYKKMIQHNLIEKISCYLKIKNKSITFQQETLLTIDVMLLLIAILLPWIKQAKIVPAFAIIAINAIAINISCKKYKMLIYTLSIIAIIVVFILKFCYNYYS